MEKAKKTLESDLPQFKLWFEYLVGPCGGEGLTQQACEAQNLHIPQNGLFTRLALD